MPSSVVIGLGSKFERDTTMLLLRIVSQRNTFVGPRARSSCCPFLSVICETSAVDALCQWFLHTFFLNYLSKVTSVENANASLIGCGSGTHRRALVSLRM